jgi:hypothetical protein
MSTHPSRGYISRQWRFIVIACLAVFASAMVAASPHAADASSKHSGPTARASRVLPRALTVAATHRRRADRLLVADAHKLKQCVGKQPGRCGAARLAVQRAGKRLAAAERRLAKVARSRHIAGSARAHRRNSSWAWQAPVLTVSGETLDWNHVGFLNSYVIEDKAPGQAVEYELVNGTSTTPPPVPGATVAYRVRSAVSGSAWSAPVSIAYPLPAQPPVSTPTPTPVEVLPTAPTVTTQAAPVLAVSGQTLSWNLLDGVNTYVLMSRIAGQEAQYSAVSGTSFTPTVVPGAKVFYSIRTAVEGSAWSSEISITFPSVAPKTPPVSETPPAPPVESSSGAFELGMVPASLAKSEPGTIAGLGAHTVRMESEIGSSPSTIAGWFEEYAKVGIRVMPLAGFEGRLPTSEQAKSLAGWAAAYGPGGTFWAGKSEPANTAMTDIEFGNETSYSYQFSNTSASAVAARAQEYAIRFKEAYEAIHAANPHVGLLAQADNGGSGNSIWVENMFKAVPNLGSMVAGWTIHPYGPGWEKRINELLAQTQAAGAPSSIPVYATEWGLSTDNGRCLSENYGWNKCMTYAEAATAVTSSITGMVTRYGSRLRGIYLYQAQDLSSSGSSTNRESYFGVLQQDGATKGPYTAAVQTLLSTLN